MSNRLEFSRKISIAFWTLLITLSLAGAIIRNTDNSFHNIDLYLAGCFILAILMPIIIGFQGKIYNNFMRSLFHAYLAVFAFYLLNMLILYFQIYPSIGVCFVVSLMVPVYIFSNLPYEDFLFSLLVYTMPIICTLLIALLLFSFRKNRSKRIRVTGQICTLLLFGGYYVVSMWHLSHSIREY